MCHDGGVQTQHVLSIQHNEYTDHRLINYTGFFTGSGLLDMLCYALIVYM